MFTLLRIPPPIALVILLAILGYIIYAIVSRGQATPLNIIFLAADCFGLARVGWRLTHKPVVDAD
jgi:hypothetical protein